MSALSEPPHLVSDMSDPEKVTGVTDFITPPSLDLLPLELICAVLACLGSAKRICRAASLSSVFADAVKEDCLWLPLVRKRCYDAAADEPLRCAFRRCWNGSREAFLRIGHLGIISGAAEPLAMSARAGGADHPVCCTSRSATLAAESVSVDEFMEGVGAVVRLLESRALTPGELGAWLCSRSAATEPVRCLAVLSALCRIREEGTCEDGSTTALRSAAVASLRRLRSCPSAPALGQAVTVKWWEWSQLRDCRGFRARDDVYRRACTLADLAAEGCEADSGTAEAASEPRRAAAARCWRVLHRGVVAEVRAVRVMVCAAADLE